MLHTQRHLEQTWALFTLSSSSPSQTCQISIIQLGWAVSSWLFVSRRKKTENQKKNVILLFLYYFSGLYFCCWSHRKPVPFKWASSEILLADQTWTPCTIKLPGAERSRRTWAASFCCGGPPSAVLLHSGQPHPHRSHHQLTLPTFWNVPVMACPYGSSHAH